MKHSIWRRAAAFVLCALLCLTPMNLSASSQVTAAENKPVIAYVPLDDRPVCVDRVLYQAQAAGFEVLMPDADLYQTHLDNQLLNSNGTQYGDGTAIMNWLKTVDARCDWFVISIDQMLSGGLVNSRASYRYSLTESETAIIDYLIELAKDPQNHVYFVDTVMRLASTGGYDGYTGAEYDALRAYGSQERKIFSTTDYMLSDYNASAEKVNKIYDNYQIGKSGETLTYDTAVLSSTAIQNYHYARHRKMNIINLMIQYAGSDASYVIGVDDASPNDNIQRNEINFIKTRMELLGRDYSLSADTDSSGMMAVAQCVNDYYASQPTVKVRYYGGREDYAADDYDIGTLRENIDTHLESLDCHQTQGDAEIELLVLTQPSAYSEYGTYISQLMTQLKTNLAVRRPTIVLDVSTSENYSNWFGNVNDNLQDHLCTEVDLSQLLGYSNWNTAGNSIGIGVAQGISRYTYLHCSDTITEASHIGFLKSMTYAYIKDISYLAKNKYFPNKEDMTDYVDKNFGTNSNFYAAMMAYTDGSTYYEDWEQSRGEHVINNELTWKIMQSGNAAAYDGCGQQILNNLQNGEMYVDLKDVCRTREVGTISLARFRFPWFRTFEMTFDITPSLDSASHTYYVENDTTGLIGLVPTEHAAQTMLANITEQYQTTAVTLQNLFGTAVADETVVGTGFTVKMTVSGGQKTYTVVIPREVTGDGKINTADVRAVMQRVVGAASFSTAQTAAADQNGDGKIGSSDARIMLQKLL